MSALNEALWLGLILMWLPIDAVSARLKIRPNWFYLPAPFLLLQLEAWHYPTAVFGFVEVTLVLYAFVRVGRWRADSLTVAWHYLGALAWCVVLTFLFGFTALYELGYTVLGMLLLLPLAAYAAWVRAFRLTIGLVLVLLVWAGSGVTGYINLFDATGGALFALVYAIWWVIKATRRLLARRAAV